MPRDCEHSLTTKLIKSEWRPLLSLLQKLQTNQNNERQQKKRKEGEKEEDGEERRRGVKARKLGNSGALTDSEGEGERGGKNTWA